MSRSCSSELVPCSKTKCCRCEKCKHPYDCQCTRGCGGSGGSNRSRQGSSCSVNKETIVIPCPEQTASSAPKTAKICKCTNDCQCSFQKSKKRANNSSRKTQSQSQSQSDCDEEPCQRPSRKQREDLPECMQNPPCKSRAKKGASSSEEDVFSRPAKRYDLDDDEPCPKPKKCPSREKNRKVISCDDEPCPKPRTKAKGGCPKESKESRYCSKDPKDCLQAPCKTKICRQENIDCNFDRCPKPKPKSKDDDSESDSESSSSGDFSDDERCETMKSCKPKPTCGKPKSKSPLKSKPSDDDSDEITCVKPKPCGCKKCQC